MTIKTTRNLTTADFVFTLVDEHKYIVMFDIKNIISPVHMDYETHGQAIEALKQIALMTGLEIRTTVKLIK